MPITKSTIIIIFKSPNSFTTSSYRRDCTRFTKNQVKQNKVDKTVEVNDKINPL